MNNFTIDMAAKSKKLNSNSILRLYKQNLMLKLMEIKSNEPKLTLKQIFNHLGYSDSTNKRYRDDISMDSPYKGYKNRKKNNKSNTTITQTQSHNSNENNKNTKNKRKNKTLKGGNPNDVHLSGKKLIEQDFQDDKVNSTLENRNHREDKTKFFTLARKMVDNV